MGVLWAKIKDLKSAVLLLIRYSKISNLNRLSNEVLGTFVDPGAAKLLDFKVEVKKTVVISVQGNTF